MKNKLKDMGIIAIELIDAFFSDKFEMGLYAIYATIPKIYLVEVIQLDEKKRKSIIRNDNIDEYKGKKYEGINVLTMRVSHTEYEYYLRLIK